MNTNLGGSSSSSSRRRSPSTSSHGAGASPLPLAGAAPISIAHLLQSASASASPEGLHASTPWPPAAAGLTRHEASLVQYYTAHLGRWLDCTDASRQFTLRIPALCTGSPVLLEAIVSLAARHRGDTEAASLAHERCIALLIVLLDSEQVADDDVLLSAIVILRVFEQLTALGNGSDQERHLAGCSALLRTSQGPCVDPAAPGLRDAAFWVYLRQCLYNACINQQAPNVDFSLTLMLIPSPGTAGVDMLRSETAWANTMTWICATIVQFCFGPHALEARSRMDKWQELNNTVADWARSRPRSFDPIWQGGPCDGAPFPEYYFAADWHIVAFGFYQLACILLTIYKPTPRFAIRSAHAVGLRKEDAQILEHARALCGSCRSHPETVPARITLCHSVFLWGGLMDDPCEQSCLVQLLEELEHNHAWPTAWIISSLKEEWGISSM
ncbi:uncharacterized protein B0I36DRAFT_147801 [Microdochium trichocladiopsis]|uniref:Fungal-specific transcription factor domain-domain-containing protein n=1 Tax=Microdochium trichocladiopsis TaxID=1682393 RepID=A0A9P8Y5V9_9PEZI|nr:uncharacterized protein B0I36DRAFT_147801 [Microdochium trichocladiopsis]KAH7028205.1 hypothetical protein B0I36DRAFT_147801 [Microdochium trichocladiopsis]